jgi:integrase
VTASPELEPDPYLLPLPAPGSPVVAPHLTASMHAHLNGRYADPVWHLAPLTGNPSANKLRIDWETWPAVFRDQMRLAVWNLVNGQLRPTFLQEHANGMRGRPGLGQIYATVLAWRLLARWLDGKGIRILAGCDVAVLHDYGQHLRGSGRDRSAVAKDLGAVTRLWALDQVSARPSGIARPPWKEPGADNEYLPAAMTGSCGENATEPIAEQTIGPLLIWAMRLVDDLSVDILAAWAERQRLAEIAATSRATSAGRAALEAYLGPLLAGQAPLPATFAGGKRFVARSYIGGLTGASRNQVDQFARRARLPAAVAQRPGPCPLDVPVTGQIAGKPWRTALDYNEARVLMRHLGTAAYIVCAYLTGARPGEVLALRTGCCPDPATGPGGQAGRHLIRGLEFKNATDEDGNHASCGAERDIPWVAITPVVNAIRVLERMVPDGHLLFSHDAHDLSCTPGTGSLKPETLQERIEEFTAWANREAARHNLTSQAIPADPHGTISLARFRRSLAWHIARQPNGLVALAIQYGHMRTAFGQWATEGYASRSRDGIHALIDLETARATADTLAVLHDDLGNGGGISGPAARRVIRAAATVHRFAGAPVTLDSARKLLKNQDAMIYDNPRALVLCHYKRDRALCHRDDVKDTPSLDHCVPGCANIARTDQQAAQLRERALALETQAAHVPQPAADRLRGTAARLRDQAGKHDRTRISTRKDTDDHAST